MPDLDRRWMRIACRIQSAYLACRPEQVEIDLPEQTWDDVQAAHSAWHKALRHRWPAAAMRQRGSLVERIDHLVSQLDRRLSALRAVEAQLPSLRDLYDDLAALSNEFSDLQLDGPTLTVTTEPITLDEIALGPFQIGLHLDRLDRDSPYTIEALEPNPAASCSETTHPHVHDQRLCPGEGRPAINAALAEGRLFDFFTLVDRVLHTYAAGSAYVELDRWFGQTCHDCDGHVAEDEGTSCSVCEERLCDDCYIVCGCDERFCSECIGHCDLCDEYACRDCVVPCRGCRRKVCHACREDELCETCREQLEEEEHAEASEAPTEVSADRAEPAV